MSDYPQWICAGCGNKYGKTYKGQLSTFHEPDPSDPTDRCGWLRIVHRDTYRA